MLLLLTRQLKNIWYIVYCRSAVTFLSASIPIHIQVLIRHWPPVFRFLCNGVCVCWCACNTMIHCIQMELFEHTSNTHKHKNTRTHKIPSTGSYVYCICVWFSTWMNSDEKNYAGVLYCTVYIQILYAIFKPFIDRFHFVTGLFIFSIKITHGALCILFSFHCGIKRPVNTKALTTIPVNFMPYRLNFWCRWCM